MKQITLNSLILFIGTMCFLVGAALQAANAINFDQQEQSLTGKQPSATLAVVENPELTARVLESLLKSVVYSANVDFVQPSQSAQKRGLDLGISRGFSGSQAGKHLMGLSAASFANGPGKR